MSKAYTKEQDAETEDENEALASPLPSGQKNYITPDGCQRLKDELLYLLNHERPEITAIVSWAAANGDRSENGDYLYGKKRLREIDRRIRFLTKRLDSAEIVDPAAPRDAAQAEQIFFGATVTYASENGEVHTVTIVGVDEIDLKRNYISWVCPLARALIKAREGDTVTLHAPRGREELDILKVCYQPVSCTPFTPGNDNFARLSKAKINPLH